MTSNDNRRLMSAVGKMIFDMCTEMNLNFDSGRKMMPLSRDPGRPFIIDPIKRPSKGGKP